MVKAHRKIRRYFQIEDSSEPTGYRYYKIVGFLKQKETTLFAREAFARVVDKKSEVVGREDAEFIWKNRDRISPELFDALSQNRLLTSWDWNFGLPNCFTYFDVSFGEVYRHTTKNVDLVGLGENYLILVRYRL